MGQGATMGETAGSRASGRCRAFWAAASEYAGTADLAAVVSASLPLDPDRVEIGCWGGPVTKEPSEVRVAIEYDGNGPGGGAHLIALNRIAARHGAAALPMRLEPEHPVPGEPYTMILTYHFTEG
jgi:hypothetical protein